METSGIRAMQEAVYREGEVSMEKVDSLEPRLDNVTVQHMQLTRSAIQTIDSYQNHDNIVPLQVSLQSQGLQGLTNIPPNNSPTDVYKFNFQLSNMNNKNREDHNQQTDSSCSPSELSCMQLMPDEIVCRTANSYPMTQPVHSNSNSCNTARDQGSQDPYVVSFSQNSICENQCDKHSSLKTLAPIPTQIKFRNLMENKHLMSNKFQYKIMEHKVNSQEYHIEVMEKQKTDSERQSEGANPESCEEVEQVSADSGNTCSTSGLQDYLTNYVTIVSSEQRQHYKQEFKAEYDEYRALYDKMQTVSSIFTNLDSKRKHLPPDSKEYDKITKKMSLEYHKMRQIHPNYFSERYRYQYLYKKLAHIKRLIKDYDKQQVQ
ncbi:RNA polymerase II elongation factor ELL2 [Myotis brandtii]|uniref:RNA polymerase II elongation factor ELL2 n=1 Tax=Myotis brandtii TaxID=109478 RepID=S7N1Y2_MYOBR|nr:RNA polymerase II elongation factor ELL2 [Myotis brandtii]